MSPTSIPDRIGTIGIVIRHEQHSANLTQAPRISYILSHLQISKLKPFNKQKTADMSRLLSRPLPSTSCSDQSAPEDRARGIMRIFELLSPKRDPDKNGRRARVFFCLAACEPANSNS
ncbi:hypothetical protein GWI33_016764 [Rhynchophorus ferrugineus]|uniref:Uncharacterized protein n=1 Tax=Rhynchophorus ferrugineus TaxID=354439 RepID=A0A834M6U4_RHYFE|nr:hypothetical protein GWI33_016764 [Rhynchophorus ferrugineus]